MSKRKKIVTSQIESNDSNNSEPNTFSYDTNGEIVYYDSDAMMHPFMDPGIVYGANYDSSDQSNLNTIKLIPDPNSAFTVDQYLIVEPTGPDHIHIRAGGNMDESRATLILGGERNAVLVGDDERSVGIVTRPTRIQNTYVNSNEANNDDFMVANGADIQVGYTVTPLTGGGIYTVTLVTPDAPDDGVTTVVAEGLTFISGESYIFTYEETWDNFWQFNSDGVFSGPAMGGVKVPAIANSADGNDLYVYATGADINIEANDGKVVITGLNGEFLNDMSIPENQIATIGDISSSSTNSFQSVRYTPTFTATGLTFTGSGATHPTYNSYYVKQGQLVSFVIEVNLSTVTNFGTGQYKLQLPFTPAFGFNHFAGWCWADPDVSPDVGTGHTIINADTAGVTDVLDLHYLKQSGGANSPIREGLFVQGTPVTMTTISKIYINGTYIAAPLT